MVTGLVIGSLGTAALVGGIIGLKAPPTGFDATAEVVSFGMLTFIGGAMWLSGGIMTGVGVAPAPAPRPSGPRATYGLTVGPRFTGLVATF
jgi:hypothetical protein